MSKDIEETWVNSPANPAAKSAQSNKADTNDIDEILVAYSDMTGGSDYILGKLDLKPLTREEAKAKLEHLIAQETNKARLDELLTVHSNSQEFGEVEAIEKAHDRIKELTADKETK